MKIGIVDVGGGTRGAFGAGVLDYCLDNEIYADYFIGVSAGSANGASYLAKQKGRNFKFYSEYAMRKEYMSIYNFIKKRSYVDLDYIYSTLTNKNGEYPLDYVTFKNNGCDFEVVATECNTGNRIYFDKDCICQDYYDVLKASSCVPVACQPYRFGNNYYYDGGISDPIPYKRAFEKQCDKVIVILTKPKDFFRNNHTDRKMAKFIKKSQPICSQRLRNRSYVYNQSLKEILKLEKEGKLLIIAPENVSKVGTLNKDKSIIEELYKQGYMQANKIKGFING